MLGKYDFVGPDVVSHGQDVLQVAVESKNTQVVAAIAAALKVCTLKLDLISRNVLAHTMPIFLSQVHVCIMIKEHAQLY
jgi:hypothetical protein